MPGVGITVASSEYANHTYEMTADNFNALGHTAFLMDARITAAVLYDFLTDAWFREKVKLEHQTLVKLFDQYVSGLREAYKQELGMPHTP